MIMNDYLKYYGEHNISPVSQDISDIESHFRKREKLYRQLGIPTMAFKDKEILEVGPGSGYNTLAFFTWGGKNATVTLVEANPQGISEMKKLFKEQKIETSRYKIHECVIEEFQTDILYDIVIAEGFLPPLNNNNEIIQKLAGFVRPGGVIVITCSDYMGLFVEHMKRLICQMLVKDIDNYEEKVKRCVELLEPQFRKLQGMSRGAEDWVKDNVFNPVYNSNNGYLSLERGVQCFSDDFDFLGSSQRIFTDYSWYKDINFDEKNNIYRQFRKKQHNFLIVGLDETLISDEENAILMKHITLIRDAEKEYEVSFESECLERILLELKNMEQIMERINKKFFMLNKEMQEIIMTILKNEHNIEFSNFPVFFNAFGRSQQYLSMVRKYRY